MKTQTEELVSIGTRETYLRQVMEAAHMSQAQLAKLAGVPASTIAAMLNRGIAGTAVDTVARICDTLKISLDDFVHGRINDTTPVNDRIATLAANIRSVRRRLRYSRFACAQTLQMPLEDYIELESGHCIISDKHIEQIAVLFNTSVKSLWGAVPFEDSISGALEDPTVDEDEVYNFAVPIRALRNSCNLTQEALAKEISVPVQLLEDWERSYRIPSSFDIVKLAGFFDVAPSVLYEKAEAPSLSVEERELLMYYGRASERDKKLVRMILENHE